MEGSMYAIELEKIRKTQPENFKNLLVKARESNRHGNLTKILLMAASEYPKGEDPLRFHV